MNKNNKFLNIPLIVIIVYLLYFLQIHLTNLAPGISEPVPLKFQIASFTNLGIATGVLAAITVTKLILSKNNTVSKVGKGIVLTGVAGVYLYAAAWGLIFLYALWYIILSGLL
jgi:hypothetical protein